MIFRAALAVVVLLPACRADRTASEPFEPTVAGGQPLLAHGHVDQNPRAVLSLADSIFVSDSGRFVPAGIRGDGRVRDGTAAPAGKSSEYQGDWCGVSARFELGTDLNADPDAGYSASTMSACGSKRQYRFYLSGPSLAPTVSGPHSIASGLATRAVGQSVLQPEGFGVQLTNCQRLMFDSQYPPSATVRQTRLSDTIDTQGRSVRRWRIESEGSHRAMCLVPGKGNSLVPTGVTYFLPFRITIVEVPYPYSVYP